MNLYQKFKIIFGFEFNKINPKILLLNFLQIIIEVLSIALLIPFIQYLGNKENIQFENHLINKFFQIFIHNKSIFEILILLLLIYSFKTLILLLVNNSLLNCARNLEFLLSKNLLSSYVSSAYKKIANINTSILVRNIYNETGDVVSRYMQFINLITEVIILLLFIIISFYINFVFTLIVLIFFSFIAILYYFFLKNYLKKIGKDRLDNASNKIKLVNELFDNFEFIKLTQKFSIFLDYFNKVNVKYLSSIKSMSLVSIIPKYFFEPILIILLILNYISSSIMNLDNSKIIENLLIFLILSLRIIPSINRILSSLIKIKFGHYSIETIYDEIRKFKTSIKFVKSKKRKLVGDLRLINVSFSYKDNNKINGIFKKINITIKDSDIIGIVGPSGSGKTTLLKLLMGFLEPTEGNITLNKKKIFYDLEKFQFNVGYVPQKTLLLDESILFNITFSRNTEYKSNKFLREIYKIAELDDFVKFSKLNIKIGELGSKISGGQAQRISIARAMYTNPSILILDEPTANLDSKIGTQILKNIKKYRNDMRIIIVTHNKEDLFLCNKVFKIVNKEIKSYEK